jgi:iron complex outermembrane recepter protein
MIMFDWLSSATGAVCMVALTTQAKAQEATVTDPRPVQLAQTARPGDSNGRTGETSDIVVTAQKRSENLQRVPLSVLALDGRVLKERNLASITDIQAVAPGLSVRSFYTNVSGSINIRGVGTQALAVPTVEQTVSVVVDGINIGTFSGALFNFPDIERVEVLRGPQGTLFGKGASNGIINVVSSAPTAELSGAAGGSYATLNEVKLRATLSGPLADGVTARISGYRNTRDGLGTTVLPDGRRLDVNNVNEWGVRGQIKFDPTSDLSIKMLADYSRSANRCCVAFTTVADVPADPLTAGFLGLPVGYPLPIRGQQLSERSRTGFGDEVAGMFERIKGYGVTGQVDYDLGNYTVTSITAWRRTDYHGNNPGDGTPFPIFIQSENTFSFKQLSEELRLASPADRFAAFTVGLFYFHSNLVYRQQLQLAVAPPALNIDTLSNIRDDNYAAFGQGTLNLTERFRLIVGLRYTFDKQNLRFRNQVPATLVVRNPLAGFFAAAGVPIFASPFVAPRAFQANDLDADFKDDRLGYKLGAQYDIAPEINVFGTYSQGFKSGGFLTDPTAIVNPVNAAVKPEIPRGFEIGIRSRFFERRLTVNATYFDFRFAGLQTTQYDATLGSFRLVNSRARTHGVELEVAARPARYTSLTFNGAYTRALFGEGATDQCYFGQTASQGCGPTGFQDLNGTKLPDAPTWSFTAGARQELALPGSELRTYVDLSYFWRSGTNLQGGGGSDTYQPSYGRLDVTVGTIVQMGAANVSLRAFARNLTNSEYSSARLSVPPTGFWAAQLVPYESGRRVFGVAADVSF